MSRHFIGMPYQRLKAQTYGHRIRCSTTSRLRLFEEFVIDVEGFLHTYNFAIVVWLLKPYLWATAYRQLVDSSARASAYGTGITGACQNAAFCPAGSTTRTWHVDLPGGSLLSERLSFIGSAWPAMSHSRSRVFVYLTASVHGRYAYYP